jgi:hypothetical protein
VRVGACVCVCVRKIMAYTLRRILGFGMANGLVTHVSKNAR